MELGSRIILAGHRGLVGSAIGRRLAADGYAHVITRSRAELDLTEQAAVRAFFADVRPEYVFLAAARVGGIHANSSKPAEFVFENLAIQTNVIDAAWRAGVQKLLFLGSSCIYPREAPQPMTEAHLLTGPLEPTNEPYAVAKIAGITMCRSYRRQYGFDAISLMPTNLYGPGDNFDLEDSHMLPALIRKAHEAGLAGERELPVWGSGRPRRELMHVDDLADAALFAMRNYSSDEILNVGTGEDLSVREIAETVARVVGFEGALVFDSSRPDGAPRKLLDVSRINALGWRARIGLEDGVRSTYVWYLDHLRDARGQVGGQSRARAARGGGR